MKKIALIMDGWKRWFTFAWPAGILQRIRQTGEEVSLYIFNSSGGWSCDEEYNTGEYNIYRLPNLREFDGIILDLNNIGYPKVREDVIRRKRVRRTGHFHCKRDRRFLLCRDQQRKSNAGDDRTSL